MHRIDRRHFLGAAAMTVTTATFSTAASASAQSGGARSFSGLKQIAAGVLNVGYAEVGPADGKAVVLLHGWPYDIHSFVDVAPLLAAKGYRVLIPYLRGYGTTRFLSNATVRNAQQAALASDCVAFMSGMAGSVASVRCRSKACSSA